MQLNISTKFNSRGYSICPRHLSGIQAGIQTAHGASFFAKEFPEINKWYVETDATLIVLEDNSMDSIKQIINYLVVLDIPFYVFREPDLDNLITSVYFVLDEELYNFSEAQFIEYLKQNSENDYTYTELCEKYKSFKFSVKRNFNLNSFRDFKRKLSFLKLKS